MAIVWGGNRRIIAIPFVLLLANAGTWLSLDVSLCDD
jgi:hypothetical protein